MSEGNSTPEQSAKGLRSFIEKAKQIKQIRNRGNKDAVLRAGIEKTREESEIDSLTGLPNRRAFDKRYAEEAERVRRTGRKTTVMRLDLDRLKFLNDTRGHQAGDVYIRKAAETFKKSLRTTDFVARTGGDEFTVILPDTDAKLVRTVWEERLEPETKAAGIAVSAGASELDPTNPSRSEALADIAMYGAKREPNKNGNLLFIKEPQRING